VCNNNIQTKTPTTTNNYYNKIVEFDNYSGVVIAEAGCILQNLDNHLGTDYTVPIDLPSHGSCQIGGNVSTNAGGLRILRYGSLHGSVLGAFIGSML